MSIKSVPFYKPCLPLYSEVEPEIKSMYESGMLAPSKYTERLEREFESYCSVKHAVAFSSCSSALMCLLAYLKAKSKGHYVIVPDFTFAATWQAADWNGLDTIVTDVDNDGLIDLDTTENILKEYGQEVLCILAVHMFGNPAPTGELAKLSSKYDVFVCYDSAHGVGTLVNGKTLGSSGCAEVFSIGTTKPMPSGEGGVVTTNDSDLADFLHKAAMHGHKYGELDVELKSLNGRIQEFNSILAYHGFNYIKENMKKRKIAAKLYNDVFPLKSMVQLESNRYVEIILRPAITPKEGIEPSYKDYTLFIEENEVVNEYEHLAFSTNKIDPFSIREKLVKFLESCDIGVKRYYYPNISNLDVIRNKNIDSVVKVLPNSCNGWYLSRGCVSIPFYSDITTEEQEYVISKIKYYIENNWKKELVSRYK